MDQGPVDAGPSNDNDYDPPSPVRRKGMPLDPLTELPQRSRDPSQHPSMDGVIKSADNESEDKNEASSRPQDTPLYVQVGAVDGINDDYFNTVDSDKKHGRPSKSPGQHSIYRMHKLMLYETNARYWITGADISDQHYKMLRIDRTSSPAQINLYEDDIVYDRQQLNEILTTIDDGNKATGGLRLKMNFWGLLGFIRFTESYYMLIITKRQQVAMLGGHYVYQIEGTEMIPLTTGSSTRFAANRNPEETRFLGILGNLDLTKSFYFSYTYNITRTLQHNIITQRKALNEDQPLFDDDFNDMFVWNHHLLEPAEAALRSPYQWCLPIVHGFIDQAALDIFGRCVYITIIGRRSRFFAGARFLKRGINDLGYVANDVETEQIVSEMMTTSFHAPGLQPFSNPTWTSYVQHRGSIPLYWTQDNNGVNPKPDIDLNLQDPFYEPAALHFDNLFERYGCPIYVLNLIKSKERIPREEKLLYAYKDCIDYLNQSLPPDKRIQYHAFDMSRASKVRGGDVIGKLEIIATGIVETTGFFHNGNGETETTRVQNGVARTNCIDCLDRTNAAQFVMGKRAFGVQLRALGVTENARVEYDTDAVNVFTTMFHNHGDTIAVQYGGSHLVNTMSTYRKLNHWQGSSRDMVESFKRYYNNSFLDSQRQEAYNLFLGNYIWAQGQPMLWDLVTDHYLHHTDPRKWLDRPRRDYYNWYTTEHLATRQLPSIKTSLDQQKIREQIKSRDTYWIEYYRPAFMSTFAKNWAYRLNSSTRFLPERQQVRDNKHYDYSPFKPRIDLTKAGAEPTEKKPIRKGVKIIDPLEKINESPPESVRLSPMLAGEEKLSTLGEDFAAANISALLSSANSAKAADKVQMHLWSLNKIHSESLNPSVTDNEKAEYARYLDYPANLSLVTATNHTTDHSDLVEYLEKELEAPPALSDLDNIADEDLLADLDGKDIDHFLDFVAERNEVLTVTDDDGANKRYKAYRQWLKGKSLFKQSKLDPEYKAVT